MISLERPLRLVKDGRVGEAGENVERSSIADGRGRRDGGMDGKKGALEGVAIPRINNSCERRETKAFLGVWRGDFSRRRERRKSACERAVSRVAVFMIFSDGCDGRRLPFCFEGKRQGFGNFKNSG